MGRRAVTCLWDCALTLTKGISKCAPQTLLKILVSRLAHSIIYSIHDLLECMEGLLLWNDDRRISITWGNSRMSERHFSEGSVMTVYQRP